MSAPPVKSRERRLVLIKCGQDGGLCGRMDGVLVGGRLNLDTHSPCLLWCRMPWGEISQRGNDRYRKHGTGKKTRIVIDIANPLQHPAPHPLPRCVPLFLLTPPHRCRVRPWRRERTGDEPYGWDRARRSDSRRGRSNPRFASVSSRPPSILSLKQTVWTTYVLLRPSLGLGQGQCPCHLTQGEGRICWEGGFCRGGDRWAGAGGRWLSPKASAGVAGGKSVGVWVGGKSVRLCLSVQVFCLKGWMEGHQCRRTSSGDRMRGTDMEVFGHFCRRYTYN